jgi:hypothetical protein
MDIQSVTSKYEGLCIYGIWASSRAFVESLESSINIIYSN